MVDESWPNRLFATARAPTAQGVSEVRHPIRWRFSLERVLLLGSVSGNGIRSVDLSRESTRHRGVPTLDRMQSLSHGIPWQCGPFDAGRRQREARLAHLRRFRT